MLIHDRVKLIIQSNRETSSSFADKIGIKRSNLSHVLSGRNKPSLDFLEKIINYYPNVNASWLVTGKTREGEFEEKVTKVTNVTKSSKTIENNTKDDGITEVTSQLKGELETKAIEKVIIFYSNGEIKEINHSNQ